MLKRRRLVWQVMPAMAAVVAVTVGLTAWYGSRTSHNLVVRESRAALRDAAALLGLALRDDLARQDLAAVRRWVAAAASQVPYRLTVIRPDGVVLADSEEDPARMDNHADRPEIGAACRGEPGESQRYSATRQRQLLYVAVPLRQGDQLLAICRAAAPLADVRLVSLASTSRLLLAAGAAVLVGALASLWLSQRFNRVIAGMQVAANRLAAGDLDARVPLPPARELADLAQSLNSMAQQLNERLLTVTRQKAEVEAILAGMAEGVIAIDAEAVVLHLNQAAADILGQDRQSLIGRPLREYLRSPAFYDVLDRTLAGVPAAEGDVVRHGQDGEIVLQVRGSRLPIPDRARQTGAVLVLNDVTRLQRLESLRRDFAANVSHELRTPITSIKGFVETLLEGALDDRQDAERFLRIVRQHADRLESLISDLLALARVEREAEGVGLALQRQALAPVLAEVVANRQASADAKHIRVSLECPAELCAQLNPGLFQQAVTNLLDNALAYSEAGTAVRITASRRGNDLRVDVADQGRGIAPEHLGRIFERFYRVDKARSRQAGGTGLGLAIAKHVIQAHQGRILVDSTLGQGSTFTIVLPAA